MVSDRDFAPSILTARSSNFLLRRMDVRITGISYLPLIKSWDQLLLLTSLFSIIDILPPAS
jgi:hypothetical protein